MKTFTLTILFIVLCSGAYADSTWYHPNPWWKVARKNTTVTKNAFQYRWLFGQYSFPYRWTGTNWSTDDWQQWMAHNKMVMPHKLNGHSWQAFIQAYTEAFKKNPQYLAEINGIRPGYGKSSKLCVSNKMVQQLFIEYSLSQFEKNGDLKGFVSVEPSDGAGHCECDNCKKIGSISNRVFYLANITAKAIRKKFPEGGVNLLAYYQHADTPTFRLEPNVHVTVVPSGFQDLYDGDILLYAWKKKTDNLSYYDYIAIPQWKGELPRIHVNNFIRRLNIAKELNYKGFWHEVGLNLPAAISIQLMSQIWRDPSLSWDIVFSNFIEDCFPNAKVPMKRLFNRWFNDWKEDEEIILAYQDVREAEANQLTIDEKKRLTDIKAYIFYIAAYQEWRKNENPATTAQFFENVFAIADRQVVNTNALFHLFGNKIKDPTILKKYNILANKNWQWMGFMSDQQLDKKVLSNFKGVENSSKSSQKNTILTSDFKKENDKRKLAFKYNNTVLLEGTGRLIDLSVTGVDYNRPGDRDGLQYISIITSNGDLILNGLYPLKKNIRFRSKKGVTYRLAVKQVFNISMTINSKEVRTTIE